jgi:hypothetical protein
MRPYAEVMSRGNIIVVASLGGFLVSFLAVQAYMWPEWHRQDCEGLECVGALMFSIFGGVMIGSATMLITGLMAAGVTHLLAARGAAGDYDSDEIV